MGQAVGRRPLSAQARIRSQASPFGIYGGQVAVGQSFVQKCGFNLSVSLRQYSTPTHASAATNCNVSN